MTYKITEATADGFILNGVTSGNAEGTISTTASTVEFTNTRETGDLELSKKLISDRTADADQEFKFTVELGDTGIGTETEPKVYGGMTFVEGVATVTLKGGEKVTATGIPTDVTYKITEATADGFILNGATSGNAEGTISTTPSEVEFTNTRETGDLKVTKTVPVKSPADPDKEFAFKVELNDKGIGGTAPKTYGDMTFDKGIATFTLKDGETATAKDLPTDIEYTVTEEKYDGYTTTYTGETGTIVTGETVAEFANTYDAKGPVTIRGLKVIENRKFKDGDTLSVTIAGDGRLPDEATIVVPLTAGEYSADFAFGEIMYQLLEDMKGENGELVASKTFTYTVTETAHMDGTTKTVAEETVTVLVKDQGDGNLKAEATYQTEPDQAKLVNTYDSKGSVALSAKKALAWIELEAGRFSFELKDSEGNTLQTKENAADGTVSFDPIEYTLQKDLKQENGDILITKELKYTINEVVPEDAVNEAGVTYAEAQDKNDIFTKDCIRYDGRIVEIKVTLTDDQAGKIETAAEPNGESITFANEYITQGEITLSGTKKLVNRAMGENEFTFELYELQTNAEGDEEFVKIDEATNAADGSYSFTVIEYTGEDLDTDANGNYIETTKTYKVAEQADPESALIFDKTEYVITVTLTDNGNGTIETSADPAENACDFTNILVKVSKVDVADQKELEGATIQIIDKETGEVVFEFTSGEEATEIDNLETGKTYILHETVAPDGYKVTSDTEFTVDADGTITGSCTMTADEEGNIVLLVEDDKTCVRVSKVDAADGHELEGAHIQILDKDGNVVDEWDSAKDSAHEITGLLTGEDNVYTLRETVAPYGYDITTDTTFWLDAEGKVTSTGNTAEDEEGNIILLVEDDMKKIPAAVKKVWDDDENRDGVRPVSLTVDLLANGEVYRTVTLTAANGWTLLLKDLPCVDAEQKDIEYTWSERDPGNGYTLTGTSVEGILTILTNHYDTEKTSVSVQKIWDDVDDVSGKRPDSIVVQLYGDGEAVGDEVTLSEANGWSYTWTELNKNCNPNGLTGESRVIEYTVCELEVPEYYVETVTGNATTGFVITNKMDHGSLAIEKTFDLGEDEEDDDDEETTEITVTKTWNDNGNKEGNRPGSVTVHLMANGSEVASASLSEGNGWAYTFTDLPKKDDSGEKISYTISEDSVPMYTSRISGYNVINTYETELTSASVSKIWIGDDHPSSITVTLSNGQSVVLSDANGWSATINNLPVTVNGQTVTYTWTEAQVPGYRQVSVMTNGNSTVFTNEKIETPKIPEEQQEVVRRPQTPGVTLQVFEEYDTALGVNIIINHVGDCFD